MAIVGETVTMPGEPEGLDYRGRPIYGDPIEFMAVVVPEGSDLRPGSDDLVTFVSTQAKILIPNGWPVPETLASGAEVEVRGQTYYVDGDGVDHRSPFGTGRGGIELALSTTPLS